jgi:transposase
VERIKALRAAGATYRAIADELGISVKAAHKYGSQQLESAARPRLRVVPDDEG